MQSASKAQRRREARIATLVEGIEAALSRHVRASAPDAILSPAHVHASATKILLAVTAILLASRRGWPPDGDATARSHLSTPTRIDMDIAANGALAMKSWGDVVRRTAGLSRWTRGLAPDDLVTDLLDVRTLPIVTSPRTVEANLDAGSSTPESPLDRLDPLDPASVEDIVHEVHGLLSEASSNSEAGDADREIDLLGHIHESSMGSHRRKRGAHYTPHSMAQSVVMHAIAPARGLLWPSVCDPAMGCGAFLLETCRALAVSRGVPRHEIAKRCIHGVDSDPIAVAIARLSLWLFCCDGDISPPDVAHNLRLGDALTGIATVPPHPAVSSQGAPARELGEPSARGLSRPSETHRTIEAAHAAGFPFHWSTEFPEVFSGPDPGFDIIVGNPPFLGGQRITSLLGREYRSHVMRTVAAGRRGNADLCAYFFLRSAELLSRHGSFGLVATSTIAQGDTREVGLDHLVQNGIRIYRALSHASWPGVASLEVSIVWGTRHPSPPSAVLDDEPVEAITSQLRAAAITTFRSPPRRLVDSRDLAYVGSYVLGRGFVLDGPTVDRLCHEDPRSIEVIYPYLDGRDINEHPEARARRWVIQLDERSEVEARAFPAVWAHMLTHVKPERMTKNARRYPRMVHTWWKHWNNRRELYTAIRPMTRALVRARVSSTHAFAFVPTHMVASEQVIVFAIDDDARFGVLQSSIHEIWAQTHASTLGAGLRYTPSDCLETFPFPGTLDGVARPAARLDAERRELMRSRGKGLTALERQLHDATCRDDEIARHRARQRELDHAVLEAYGWTDLTLDHAFRPTAEGPRLMLSSSVRDELLQRLLALNHARATPRARPSSTGT